MIDIPCELEHVRKVWSQPAQTLQRVSFEGWDDLPDYGRTLSHEGRILACFGVAPLWEGVAEAWALLSVEVLKDFPVALSRSVWNWLEHIERRESLRRVQASVADGHEAGHRWVRWLGFDYEGRMACYGIGGHGDFHR